MIFLVLAVLGVGAAGAALYKKANAPINPGIAPGSVNNTGPIPLDLVGGVQIPIANFMFEGPADDISTWPLIELNGEHWRVAPSYIGPVGIGQAQQIAESRGFSLPTPALVDAIWRAADLKVAPLPEASDGTPKTMASIDVYTKHKTKIDAEIDGRAFQLIGGTHKDIVKADVAQPGLKAGGIGLYGWHADASMLTNLKLGGIEVHAPVSPGDGLVIQQPFGGHGLDWIDYSQGLRLCKKEV